MEKDDILSLLHSIKHPESGSDIVSSGMVSNLTVTGDKVQFILSFHRKRDPFATSIKKQAERIITERYPQYNGKITIHIKDEKTASDKKEEHSLARIKNVIAVGSAKGGVGKSTVTANLALALAKEGYSVGILDSDIYGPSQPMLFGIEDYVPTGDKSESGGDIIYPAKAGDIKIMSIGFFINKRDALVWRGPMASNALRQMIHQTEWGELDYLLIDLPPGTGDIHLSLISEIKITGAIIVSTPQELALADVVRGINMFRGEHVDIPVLGIVENMAWFSPAELPDKRYYIFGKGGVEKLAEQENIPILSKIPLILSSEGVPSSVINRNNTDVDNYYKNLADNIIAELRKMNKF